VNSHNPMSRRSFLSAAALTTAASVPLVAACASAGSGGSASAAAASRAGGAPAKGTRKLKLTLEWVTQCEFAGFYVALDKGYYDAEDIDLAIQPGGPNVNALQLLVANSADIAIASYSTILTGRDSGADVVNVGQIFARGGERLVYFADNPELADPKNWPGKKVSLWSGFSADFSAACTKYGADLNSVHVSEEGFDMTNFIKANVDLADAMTYNEYAQALSGAKGKALGLVDFNKLGTAVLEDAVAVRRDWIPDNEDLLVSFLKASIKGWVDARDNPAAAVQTVLKHGTALPLKFQTWQMNEVNKLIWPSPNGAFTISQSAITNSNDICYTYKVIKKPASPEGVDFSYRDKAAGQLSGVDLAGASFKPLDLDPATYFS
jgi:NitT/TauT family transport system substrate-binding protein